MYFSITIVSFLSREWGREEYTVYQIFYTVQEKHNCIVIYKDWSSLDLSEIFAKVRFL